MILIMVITALMLPMSQADRFIVTTSRSKGEALARRWALCGRPAISTLAKNRVRVSIVLAGDADYVVADCIAHEARGFKIDRKTSKEPAS